MRTLEPLTDEAEIEYPRFLTEAEVQFRAMLRLRRLGFDVRAEVPAYNRKLPYRRKGSRFDLVVFTRARRAACIIEIKPRQIAHSTVTYSAKALRYPHFGVPVFFAGPGDLDDLVRAVAALMHRLEPGTYAASAD